MNIEWYDPKKSPLKVSISSNCITFYNDTIEAMGLPEYIQIGFDEINKIIAVKCCSQKEENSIAFISKKRNSYVRIFNKNLIRFIKSGLSKNFGRDNRPQIYLSEWNDKQKILYIMLGEHLC